jgi:hypothetical protein
MAPLFVIQSHKDREQLARLARVIRRGCVDSTVLISHDVRATPLPASLFGADPHIHVIEGQAGRGDFAIVDGYLAALRYARDNLDYDWVTNLSGQDYPVASLAAFADELSAADHDGFLHHFDAIAQDANAMRPMSWPPRHGYDRYYYQYAKLKNALTLSERAALKWPRVAFERLNAPFRINTAYGLQFGRRAAATPFTPQFRCYAGSYWHTIRRHCADYLLDFAGKEPRTVDYLRNVLIPDECFVQTLLVNEPRFRFVNDNRRYYDMRGSRRGHPKVLTAQDTPEFLGGRFAFARKFDASSGTTLFDTLDRFALASRGAAPELITQPVGSAAPVL